MSKPDITKLNVRYKMKYRGIVFTFEVDRFGKITFFTSPNSRIVKDYHFELSDGVVLEKVAEGLVEVTKFIKQVVYDERKDNA